VGVALTSVERLAGSRANRATRYRCLVASSHVRLALALAFDTPASRSPSDPSRRPLIQKMHRANPFWGAPRIHGELQKLGIEIAETTVAKYLGRRPSSPSPTWRTFLRTHLSQCASMDFFTVPTATLRVLFVLVILSHDRRRVVHVNVTDHPTAAWTRQQIREAFPDQTAPVYLIRDRDGIYGPDGAIVQVPHVGGLHHHYERRAA
jgi:putative transposase